MSTEIKNELKDLEDKVAELKNKIAADTKTAIHVVLDRSGSMGVCWDATIEGFNTFLREQKDAPGEAVISLVQFDDKYEPNYMAVPVGEAPYLNRDSYQPRGSTALNDAIGRSIGDLEKSLQGQEFDHVVFVIFTDGYENASTEYQRDNRGRNRQLEALIKRKHDQNKWHFVYLGANQDAVATSNNIGGQALSTNSVSYNSTPSGTYSAMTVTSGMTKRLRGMSSDEAIAVASAGSLYTDDEKDEIEETK